MSSRRLAVLGTALATITAGLMTGATTTSADAAAAAVPTVEVFIKRDHTVVMPTEITPGTNRYLISSRRAASFQILMGAPGYTKRELVRDVVAGLNNGRMPAFKRFEANTTLLGGMSSTADQPATMWVDLEPGTYWAVDTMKEVPEVSDIATFTVAGTPTTDTVRGQVIRATGEAKFGPMTSSIRTRGKITFQNRSDVPHFLSIAKLAKGKTMRDFRQWMEQLEQGNETPPPVNFNIGLDTGVIDGGKSSTFRYRLPAGRYVMTCWWPDADMGGMPHAMMGMYRGLKVG